MLVVMTGLPGTGKSAVADGVARAIDASVFSVDPIEGVLRDCGIAPEQHPDRIAYDLARALAEAQLLLGHHVVVDAMNPLERVREAWRAMAERHRIAIVFIQTVCSDVELHRRRIAGRRRGISGYADIEWSTVEEAAGYYEPLVGEALVLDAVRAPDDNLGEAIAYVEARRT